MQAKFPARRPLCLQRDPHLLFFSFFMAPKRRSSASSEQRHAKSQRRSLESADKDATGNTKHTFMP